MAEGWTHNHVHCACRYCFGDRCENHCNPQRQMQARNINSRSTGSDNNLPPINRRHSQILPSVASSTNNDRLLLPSNQTTCRYYQRGTCFNGLNCRFLHINQDARMPVHHLSPGNCSGSNTGNSCSSQCNDRPATSASGMSSIMKPTRNLQDTSRKMSVLKNQSNSSDSGIGDDPSESWVNAPEFIPSSVGNISGMDLKPTEDEQQKIKQPTISCGTTSSKFEETNMDMQGTSPRPTTKAVTLKGMNPKSYAEALNPTAGQICNPQFQEGNHSDENKICPYLENGKCEYESQCPYIHGDICELCGHACLHPSDIDQRKKHTNECIKQHELDMELSFAVARSKDKTCGVCFEVVMEKNPREQRFGILPNCNHCFCLICIRKWRQAKQFENKIIRACPECRVTSDFVCPSIYWVDTKEDKDKLIKDYKGAMSVKHCKYFKSGRGKCQFGNKCFYLHAYPDGTKADVGPPVRHHRRHNADGDFEVLQQIILWDFLDERESRWLYSIDDLEVAFFSDSDDSDWSEYDFFFD